MIVISRRKAKEIFKTGELSTDLLDKRISIIMKREDAERWLTALRSGKYKQTRHKLHDEKTGGFCCLGLEQYCNWGGYVETDSSGTINGLPSQEYLLDTGKMYYNAFGEEDNAPDLGGRAASFMNDDDVSFRALAGYIEKHLAVYP